MWVRVSSFFSGFLDQPVVDKKGSEDVRTKRVVDNRGIFRLQQVQSPYVDTWGFSHCIQLRSPYVLLQIVFKVKFTTKKQKTRRKFDFEDDSEENIRRSNLYAVGKSPCIYIRRSNLLHRKNPCVVHQPFCPHQPFCQPRASHGQPVVDKKASEDKKASGQHRDFSCATSLISLCRYMGIFPLHTSSISLCSPPNRLQSQIYDAFSVFSS